ncbi:signal peptidase I [Enterococcus sp. LJL120]
MENKVANKSKLMISLIIAGLVLLLANCGMLLYGFIFPKYIVHGESMEPTLLSDEIVQITSHGEPERFDVVVLHPPTDEEETYIKRVIGLPGENVYYADGQLYINALPVGDTFSTITNNFSLEELFGIEEIPANYYLVLGDNREISLDSRIFGLVSQEEIIGIVGG